MIQTQLNQTAHPIEPITTTPSYATQTHSPPSKEPFHPPLTDNATNPYTPPFQTMDFNEEVLKSNIELFSTPLHSNQKNNPIKYLQVFNTYIVLNTPQGLSILDQHAVHERILYEKFKVNFEKPIDKQQLLISEVIDLSNDLFQIFETEKNHIKQLGFIIETFGNNQIIIREIPIVFEKEHIKDIILNILDQFKNVPASTPQLSLEKKEAIQLKACKAAIKAGQKMSDLEIDALLNDLIHSPSNYTCPHGRPLCITLDKYTLEKMFLRK